MILKTKKVLLGQYHESIKVTYFVRKKNSQSKDIVRLPREVVFKSAPVCCLADIPIAHLAYHARRYGKFAIGFHRGAVVRHKFSPVFYALNEAEPVQSLRRCFSKLEAISEDAFSQKHNISSFAADIACEQGHPVNESSHGLWDIEMAFESIGDDAKETQSRLRESLAFVKTFSHSEFSTVYCEREWRSTKEFAFELEDVAMIVLPRQPSTQSYFDEFLRAHKLPRSVPIVPWEDLVEYQD
jgi:hypothetical protein